MCFDIRGILFYDTLKKTPLFQNFFILAGVSLMMLMEKPIKLV